MALNAKSILVLLACVMDWRGQAVAQAGQDVPPSPAAARQDAPAWVQRGLPGPGHAMLKTLEGTWRVEKSLHIAVGTRDDPAVSNDLICRRELVAGGRYLHDLTEGSIAGSPYWRLGLLGYSTMDERYEWVTIDAANANMMIYLGRPGSGEETPVSLYGVFTDQGMLGEETVGQPVGQRTEVQIISADRHVVELYFTPPGGEEFLADRSVYTRLREPARGGAVDEP